MASTAAPTNVFYVIGDYNVANGGMGSGQPLCPDFVAPTLAAATQTAFLFATIMQLPVRLVNKFNNAGTSGFQSTAIAPGSANVALTVSPSGVFAVEG